MKKTPIKIFIIAGEYSGDSLGARLCSQLRSKAQCEFMGIGGEKMKGEGVDSIFPIEKISLMGYIEILPHIIEVSNLIKQTVEEIKKFDPDIIVTIDSPGFCFRVIKRVESLRAKKIHYVAPSIWVKPKRIQFLERCYDKVLSILPFESEYFKESSIPCKFVGHSILEEKIDEGSKAKFYKKFKIPQNKRILTVLSGSRKSEIRHMWPIFTEALNLFVSNEEAKDFYIAFLVASESHKIYIESQKGKMLFNYVVVSQDDKKDLYAASELALVKSGTSSLELAVAKVPMVVAYKVNAITAFIVSHILKFKGFASIINILANRMIIPENLQSKCNPKTLSQDLLKLLNKRAANKQVNESQKQIKKLFPPNGELSSEMAASEILSTLKNI